MQLSGLPLFKSSVLFDLQNRWIINVAHYIEILDICYFCHSARLCLDAYGCHVLCTFYVCCMYNSFYCLCFMFLLGLVRHIVMFDILMLWIISAHYHDFLLFPQVLYICVLFFSLIIEYYVLFHSLEF